MGLQPHSSYAAQPETHTAFTLDGNNTSNVSRVVDHRGYRGNLSNAPLYQNSKINIQANMYDDTLSPGLQGPFAQGRRYNAPPSVVERVSGWCDCMQKHGRYLLQLSLTQRVPLDAERPVQCRASCSEQSVLLRAFCSERSALSVPLSGLRDVSTEQ